VDVLVKVLGKVGRWEESVQSSLLALLESTEGNVERVSLGDTVKTDVDAAVSDSLDVLFGLGTVPVVDDLVGAVRLDQVKVSLGADTDDLVADRLGELHGEQADRGGSSVDQVLNRGQLRSDLH
jgi:hypothetical protein